jgi:hypothetical protein
MKAATVLATEACLNEFDGYSLEERVALIGRKFNVIKLNRSFV